MGRMINPTMVAYDPSFDPGQPAVVGLLSAFVGVRTKMNMQLMQERLRRADPTIWWEQAAELRKQAADLRKSAAGIEEAYLEQRGRLVTNMMAAMGSAASAEMSAQGQVAAARIRAETDLFQSHDRNVIEIATLYNSDPAVLQRLDETLSTFDWTAIPSDSDAAFAQGALQQEFGLSVADPQAAVLLKMTIDSVGLDAGKVAAGDFTDLGMGAAARSVLNKKRRYWEGQPDSDEKTQALGSLNDATEALFDLTGGAEGDLSGALGDIAGPNGLDKAFERLDRIGVGGMTDEIIKWGQENAQGFLQDTQPRGAADSLAAAAALEIEAAKKEARGNRAAEIDPSVAMTGGSSKNLLMRPVHTKRDRLQDDLDMTARHWAEKDSLDYQDAVARNPFRPGKVLEEVRETGQVRRPTSPSPDVASYLVQLIQTGETNKAIKVAQSLPFDLQVALNLGPAFAASEKAATSTGDGTAAVKAWTDVVLASAEDLRARGGVSVDEMLAVRLEGLSSAQNDREYIEGVNAIIEEFGQMPPEMLGDSLVELHGIEKAFDANPTRAGLEAMKRDLTGLSARADNRAAVAYKDFVDNEATFREAQRVQQEETGPPVLPPDLAEFAMSGQSTYDLPANRSDLTPPPPPPKPPVPSDPDLAEALDPNVHLPEGGGMVLERRGDAANPIPRSAPLVNVDPVREEWVSRRALEIAVDLSPETFGPTGSDVERRKLMAQGRALADSEWLTPAPVAGPLSSEMDFVAP